MLFIRVWCVLVILASCGSQPPAGDDDDGGPPDASADPPYDDPSDFSRDGCVAGSFTDRSALGGVYSVDGFAIRLDPLADGAWAGLFDGSAETAVTVTDDDVFLRHTGDASLGALDLCARRDDGALVGHVAFCGEPCTERAVIAYPMSRGDEPIADGMTFLGEHPWAVPPAADVWYDLRVRDGVAYVIRNDDGFRVIDVGNPSAPVERAHVEPPDLNEEGGPAWWNYVEIADGPAAKRYALLGAMTYGVYVYDVTSPGSPAQVGEPIPSIYGAEGMALDGTRLYVGDGANDTLRIWDVADPAAATQVGELAGHGHVPMLAARGPRLYADKSVVDVTNPATPQELQQLDVPGLGVVDELTAGARTLAIFGRDDWFDGFRVLDVTDLSAPVTEVLATYRRRPGIVGGGLVVDETRVVIAMHQDGVRVVDLADPANPTEVAHHHTWIGDDLGYSVREGAVDVDVDPATGRIYVLDRERGLLIFQLD
jgi:hypothetical protein